jgi:SAM-dependent methyltransferase
MNQNPNAKEDWAHVLFVEHPHLFLPELEKLQAQSEAEVNGLCRIFEEFRIGTESRILDLSCGIGRHAIPLAKRGYQVVGYDPSKFFLEKAQQRVEDEIGNDQKCVRFYEGGIDRIFENLSRTDEGEFDAIICMFNSIGYSSTTDDLKLFRDILNLAVHGAILVTETENRDFRIRNFLPYINYDFNRLQIHESWKFNFENSTAESICKFYEQDESKNGCLRLLLDLPIHMRLYSLHELKEILNKSGWTYQKSYGDIRTLNIASFDNQEIVTISKKLV